MLDLLTDGLVCMCAVIEPNFPSKYAAIFERTLETLLVLNIVRIVSKMCFRFYVFTVEFSINCVGTCKM